MLKQLKYLQSVVRLGSFSAAAEENFISQSAISQQVQSLERELGFALLVRKNRSFSLTPAGEYFYRKSLLLTADCDRMCAEAAKIAKGEAASLKIGYLRTYAGGEFHRALAAFSARYPDVSVSIAYGSHGELCDMLSEDRVEITLNDQRRLFSDAYENLILAARPALIEVSAHSPIAQMEAVAPAELKNFPCILIAPPPEREAEQASGALDWAAVSPCLDDAVLFLDEEDRVCGFNPAATALYRRMGYIGTLAGMPVNNIQPAALSECDQDRHETALANRVLQYQRLPLSSGQARAALIIHDLTRQRQLEEELALQRTALQELRHRMKNNLQMLANLTRSRGCDPAESPPVQTALLDTANRLLSLAATLDGIVQVSREKVSLLQILEQIRRYMLQTLLPSARRVTIHVGG